uniref:Uncharacterized protein n=1 Tax=Glossina brevipalpis TaxID=37001 RepID=A0A1A9X596_9MUSC
MKNHNNESLNNTNLQIYIVFLRDSFHLTYTLVEIFTKLSCIPVLIKERITLISSRISRTSDFLKEFLFKKYLKCTERLASKTMKFTLVILSDLSAQWAAF